ncbi:MAG TPA: hypothetical protein VJ828_08335, partial [Lacipirellulaceae bacterium]|nr:hypothetical protein [Lacipirellulaceae bacterium]
MGLSPSPLTVLKLLLALVVAGACLAAANPRDGKPESESPPSEIEVQLEEIVALHEGRRLPLVGRILVEATAGDVLLQTDDGTLWLLEAAQVLGRRPLDEPF